MGNKCFSVNYVIFFIFDVEFRARN